MELGRRTLVLLVAAAAAVGPQICMTLASPTTVTTNADVTVTAGDSIQLSCTYWPKTTASKFGYLSWAKDDQEILTYACDGQSCGVTNTTVASSGKYVINVDMVFSGNLTINSVGQADEGSYTCSLFTSDFELDSSTTELTVISYVAPVALVISDSWSNTYPNRSTVQIQAGQAYQLKCATLSPTAPATALTLSMNGIANSVSEEQVDEPDTVDSRLVTSYRIVSVTPGMTDSGKTIGCTATHAETNVVLYSEVVLDVQACPSSVMVHQCPTAVTAGNTATIGCRAAATSPPPTLYWRYNDVRVPNTSSDVQHSAGDDGAFISTYSRLFEKSDMGKDITCCIEGNAMCEEMCSTACNPDIRYPPSDVEVNSNMDLESVVEGGPQLEINCTADGNPMRSSHITWTRVDEAGNAMGPRRSSPLIFNLPSSTDAGIYRCTVDNGVGSSRSTHIKIIILHGPNITSDRQRRVHGNEGDSATLTCSAEAFPKPIITWYTPDNRTITSPHEDITSSIIKQTDYSIQVRSLLHISNIDPAKNYGDYRCVAHNDYGNADFVMNLSGISKPFPPRGVRFDQKATTTESLELRWQAGYDGGAPQNFTVTSCREGTNEKCEVHRAIQERRFKLDGLEPFTWYGVSVTGVNEFGESDASPLARNSTAPLAPHHFGVAGTYNKEVGHIAVIAKDTLAEPIPEDMCFHLEIKLIIGRIGQREGTCLGLNDTVQVGTDASQSQLWLVACGRGVCGESDQVIFPQALEVAQSETQDINIYMLVGIGAAAVVCVAVIVIIVVACRWNRKSDISSLKAQPQDKMSSRKLPTLPRGGNAPPRTCQDIANAPNYDDLEMGAVNAYMQPYAQTTLQTSKAKNSEKQNNSPAPPSGEDMNGKHNVGTYTTTLGSQGYVPMNSPCAELKSASQKSTKANHDSSNEGNLLIIDDGPSEPTTGILVEIDSEDRKKPTSEDDLGYYSVPKGTPAIAIDSITETTPLSIGC